MTENKDIKKEDEIDIREIFNIFLKRKWRFIGSVLIILIAGLIFVFFQAPNYILTYQIEVNKNYSNTYLSNLYPNYEEELNYISITNVPVIFKSESVFKSLEKIDENIDYNKLLEPGSETVKITLNENTSIFNITISNPDYSLADKIGKTLIDKFDNVIKDKEKIILNKVLEKIVIDIKDLENKNDNYINTIISDLEDEIDRLYIELNRYIVDYNVGLSDELKKNSENVSFYNIIIPPNKISVEILDLQKEKNLYRQKVYENKIKITDLNNLKESLINDEDIILSRINLISENPVYEIDSNRLRNSAIVIVLSLIVGAIVVFVVDFLNGLKEDKKKSK